MRFWHDIGGGYALTLFSTDRIAEHLELINRNLPRLAPWEQWAQAEQTREELESFMRSQLEKWVAGSGVPCYIVAAEPIAAGAAAGTIVGSIDLRIDGYHSSGEIGYWIDADHEGKGIVTRACEALIEHGRELGLQRFELRVSAQNERSQAVAKRLGFEQEGVLRSAMRVGERRDDVLVFGLVG